MQSYTVHLAVGGRIEDTRFVPDRWAWLGFAFGPLWLAYHRLWITSALSVVVFLAIAGFGIAQGMNPGAASMLSTLINLAIGLEGNSLRRWKLERQGERVVAVVAARTLEEAETRYFSHAVASRPVVLAAAPATHLPTTPAASAPAGVIGLFPQPGGRM